MSLHRAAWVLKTMYRITRTMLIRKDGCTESSHAVIDVNDLEAYRKTVKGDKYITVNFVYSEIDDNGENRNDAEFEASKDIVN